MKVFTAFILNVSFLLCAYGDEPTDATSEPSNLPSQPTNITSASAAANWGSNPGECWGMRIADLDTMHPTCKPPALCNTQSGTPELDHYEDVILKRNGVFVTVRRPVFLYKCRGKTGANNITERPDELCYEKKSYSGNVGQKVKSFLCFAKIECKPDAAIAQGEYADGEMSYWFRKDPEGTDTYNGEAGEWEEFGNVFPSLSVCADGAPIANGEVRFDIPISCGNDPCAQPPQPPKTPEKTDATAE